MAKTYEQDSTKSVNMIAAGTIITGDITSSCDCRIDGKIIGNIKSVNKVIIGESGEVEGIIECASLDIEGAVKTQLTVTELLSLRATAVLSGDVVVGKISIEPGAQFQGMCKMHNEQSINS
ncbi:MAG: polymer-forming cytoskeletal protein [Bacteroidales bacterium]|jgi:cytoskeletal protein CcmA (bactofilin family)|nr:polymer-forming cytoskeletal protein [Bacteroidales bacterium]